MEVALWISTILLTPVYSYTTSFAGASLSFGRSLGEVSQGRGYQDAVTPPWEVKVGLLSYALSATVLGISWHSFGFGQALLMLCTIFFGAMLVGRLLPNEHSLHFKTMMLQSMTRRYADFVRDGDLVRADVMKTLLQRAGCHLDFFSNPVPNNVADAVDKSATH